MIQHDSAFEDAAKAPIKQTHTEVVRKLYDQDTGVWSDDTLAWASTDYLMSVNIDAIGTFLGTSTKRATAKLQYKRGLNTVITPSAGDVFQVRLGLNDSDPFDPSTPTASYNYISQGFFVVESVAYDYEVGSVTVTMYDHMWGAQDQDSSGTSQVEKLVFEDTTTIEDLAEQSAAFIGVRLMPGFGSLPNADKTMEDLGIEGNPYANISNITMQAIIRELAGATGTTARITDTTTWADGPFLEFVQFAYDDDTETLDSVTLRKLTVGKQYGPVTSVVLGRVPQNDNVVESNPVPLSNIISDISPSTNLFTIEASGMVDGNLVQITSTGDLPAPLEAGVNYFVFTDDDPDTFALTTTYADAIAGTNIIDITSAGSGTITLSSLQNEEIQINNNILLDNKRQDLLPFLYESLVGIEWNESKSTTTGLGWHEVGDVVQYSQESRVVRSFIDEVHLVLEGNIKEDLVSSIPDMDSINYQTAGGIIKTLYNTEIKVDKQASEITSIVSQQDIYANMIQENFTELYQNLTQILLTIQNSGGGNLILNSVGFANDDAVDDDGEHFDKLIEWEYNTNYAIADNGTVKSYLSSESQGAGAVAGQAIEMNRYDLLGNASTNGDAAISQVASVAVGPLLSLVLRVNNAIATGTATITVRDDGSGDILKDRNGDDVTYTLDSGRAYEWEEIAFEPFIALNPTVRIEISIDNAQKFVFTDLRLMYGETSQGWVQAATEILSTNVQFTKNGMKIFDNVHDTETQVTYNEFSTRRRSDGEILFEADDTGVVTNDLSIKGATSYYDKSGNEVIRRITIDSGSPLAGIAYIGV